MLIQSYKILFNINHVKVSTKTPLEKESFFILLYLAKI